MRTTAGSRTPCCAVPARRGRPPPARARARACAHPVRKNARYEWRAFAPSDAGGRRGVGAAPPSPAAAAVIKAEAYIEQMHADCCAVPADGKARSTETYLLRVTPGQGSPSRSTDINVKVCALHSYHTCLWRVATH